MGNCPMISIAIFPSSKSSKGLLFMWLTEAGSQRGLCGRSYPGAFKNMACSTPMIGRVTKPSFSKDGICTANRNSILTMGKDSTVLSASDALGW
jgi:hypothetical protein